MSKDRRLRSTFAGVATLGGLLLMQSTAALGTTNYFELNLEQLLEIKVRSASKKEEPVAKAPAAVYDK